jgi:hypothetical protein
MIRGHWDAIIIFMKTVLTDGYQLDHIVLYVEGTLMVVELVEQSRNKEEK